MFNLFCSSSAVEKGEMAVFVCVKRVVVILWDGEKLIVLCC